MRTQIEDMEREGEIEVVLDANATSIHAGRRIKFWVDLKNHTSGTIDIEKLSIELTAAPAAKPEKISLRREWGYNWQNQQISLLPGRKMTIPIVPEVTSVNAGSMTAAGGMLSMRQKNAILTSEFPLDQLEEGPYEIRAIVNGTLRSKPYTLRVEPYRAQAIIGQLNEQKRG